MRAKNLLNTVNEVAASRWKLSQSITKPDMSIYDSDVDEKVYYILNKAGYKYIETNKVGIFSNDKQIVCAIPHQEGGLISGLVQPDKISLIIYYIKRSDTWEVSSLRDGIGQFNEKDIIRLLNGSLLIADAKPISGWKP